MNNRVTLQNAFILHHRPLRETSVILDVFTEEHGFLSLVARGVRVQRSKLKSLLQPFTPLILSWQGKNDLKNLVSVEAKGPPFSLRGDCLLSGFYINELLVRLLQKQDPYPRLFAIYQDTLKDLTTLPINLNALRYFEKNLLAQLGYSLPLKMDFSTGKMIEAEGYYHYYPEQGFKSTTLKNGFKGEHLIAFESNQILNDESLREIKRLMRAALTSLLGHQDLQSRELFKKI